MYSKFNLKISDSFYNMELNKHLEKGKRIYEKHGELTKKSLKEFIYDNNHIDGTSMKSNWFEIKNVDVFISHSHKDINKVKAFAGWLYDKFGLTAFIDSCAWGYCDDLLKEIDDKHCKIKNGESYDYNLRNYTTSHVHMMLSTALTEMIDNTECVMFYNTPNSVSLVDDLNALKEKNKEITLSPWIYYELAMTSLVRRRKPERTIALLEKALQHTLFSERNTINIEYDIEKYLVDMIDIESEQLKSWDREYAILTHQLDGDSITNIKGYEDIFPLDVLYFISRISKQDK